MKHQAPHPLILTRCLARSSLRFILVRGLSAVGCRLHARIDPEARLGLAPPPPDGPPHSLQVVNQLVGAARVDAPVAAQGPFDVVEEGLQLLVQLLAAVIMARGL